MSVLGLLWIVIIGFVAGFIARWVMPGEHKPSGFILTCLLGIAGAFVSTQIGQTLGWYRLDQGAGFIGATVGAIIVLAIWGYIANRLNRTPPEQGEPRRWL
ncbi:GlsB/YeaQ/YmgE family stress response membrane protein [Beijerinckia mobilis]|uniref:GlsB/YeaQ/YmgE family stress response membrane protein n=1 Tax=Beijerinckia mobilis TaxID=231434 RepID=UPI003522B3C1